MNKENLGTCKRCGEPKDTHTNLCSECLHLDRIAHAIKEGRDWVEFVWK